MDWLIIGMVAGGCFFAGFVVGFLVCTSRIVLPDNADTDNWSDFQ